MQINSSVPTMSGPVLSGSIEEMIAKLSVELEDQAAEQRKASRKAEDARHQAALASINKKREAAQSQMLAGLVSSAAAVGSSLAGGEVGEMITAGGKLGSVSLSHHASNQKSDASERSEQAAVMERARNQHGDGADNAQRFGDKALTHLSDIQRLIHESRMSAIRG